MGANRYRVSDGVRANVAVGGKRHDIEVAEFSGKSSASSAAEFGLGAVRCGLILEERSCLS